MYPSVYMALLSATATATATASARGTATLTRARPALGDVSRSVEVLATRRLAHGGYLVVSAGSVVGFRGDAIVNAANQGCQGGGGVDGAISSAGGPELAAARKALPIVPGRSAGTRCLTGDAVITVGGRLRATHCIHAVGPNYHMYGRGVGGRDTLEQADADLRTAYTASMALGQQHGLKTIGFSLLSAGIFRGTRSLAEVLAIGVKAIGESDYPGLEEVHMVGYTQQELATLSGILEEMGGPGE